VLSNIRCTIGKKGGMRKLQVIAIAHAMAWVTVAKKTVHDNEVFVLCMVIWRVNIEGLMNFHGNNEN
jgi:hypothetical protein